MNSDWHRQHVLPRGASIEQRIAWHREHQRRCACRPIPPKLQEQMATLARGKGDPAIDEYLVNLSPKSRALLQKLRKTIHALVPDVEECISYRLPAFRFQGRIIAGFSATSKGCSYYPFSGTTLKTLAAEIAGYSQTKSALHFGPGKPLPAALVGSLLNARIAEGGRSTAPSPRANDDTALLVLIRAIVARDARAVRAALIATPALPKQSLTGGATRADSSAHYFEEIEHYVYRGDTALHVAAAAYDPRLARELISRGADVVARNRRGAEPLHYAADGGPTLRTWNPRAQANTVEYLIAAGANPNSVDDSGVAPIHRAVRCRCTDAVRALIAGGADPGLKNKAGSTPMDLATQATGRGGSGTPEAKAEQERIITLLRASQR